MSRSFFLLAVAYFISSTALSGFLLVQQHLTINVYLQPGLVGLLFAVNFIPKVLFIPLGGYIADSFSRKGTLLATNILRTVLLAGAFSLEIYGHLDILVLFALSFLFGLLDALFIPAANSLLPQLVSKDRLHRANSLFIAAYQVGIITGPLLAVLAIESSGIASALLLISLILLICSVCSSLIKSPVLIRRDSNNGAPAGLIEGFVLVRQLNISGHLLLLASVSFFFTGVLMVLTPLLAAERFGPGSHYIGTLNASFGLGVVIYSLLMQIARNPVSPSLLKSAVILGSTISLLTFLESYPVVIVSYVLMGMVLSSINISVITFLQKASPEKLVGRVLSTAIFASQILLPLSFGLVTLLTTLGMTVYEIVLLYGVGLLLVCLMFRVYKVDLGLSLERTDDMTSSKETLST